VIEAVQGMVGDGMGRVELRSFDLTLEALRFALEHAEELGYPNKWRGEIGEVLRCGRVQVGRVCWRVEVGDFRAEIGTEGSKGSKGPGAILFDPYSPAANPGMWTREVFRGIRECADEDCTLTSYSRSTVTRARLMLAGWYVGRGAATGEKTETTIAATRMELLREPLTRDWLERVRRSTAVGLRDGGVTVEEVVRELEGCGQMRGG
jgi:hypothetical protein